MCLWLLVYWGRILSRDIFNFSGLEHSFSGFFVVVEGMNGVGKSTLVSALTQKLVENGYEAIPTHLPTDLIRESSLYRNFVLENRKDKVDFEAFQLLHIADRIQHSQKYILPLLKQGKIVLCDRYFYSTFVTMCIHNKVPFDWFFRFTKRLIKPDLTVVLGCPLKICLKRIKLRDFNRYLTLSNEEFQLGLRLYEKIASSNKDIFLNTKELPPEKIVNILFEKVKYKFIREY